MTADATPRSRIVVIGVGNRDRGDDAVGPTVCDRLAALDLPGVEIVVAEACGVDLALSWAPDDRVTIVDALRPAGNPGRVVEIDALRYQGAPTAAMSTHEIDLFASIELAHVLDVLPEALTVVGIEGRQFDYGAPLSPEVSDGANRVVERWRRIGGGRSVPFVSTRGASEGAS